VKSALAVAAVAAVAAGCGGSQQSDTAGIRAALVASKASYLHFAAPIWWGRLAHPRLTSVRTDGKFAVAHVSVPGVKKLWRSQWALLESDSGGWRVLAVVLDRSRNLQCKAPKNVMRTLAGGCLRYVLSPAASVEGPQASRPASSAEHRAIAKVLRRSFDPGHNSCVKYSVTVSRLDPHYARVRFVFHKPYTNCDLFNGQDVVKLTSSGWKDLGGASDPFTCNFAPPGIIRSLFGMCWVYFPR
jgi:hypothetical protein